MRAKIYTHGVTFFTTKEMYETIKRTSHGLGISISDYLRDLIEINFKNRISKSTAESQEKNQIDRETDRNELL